MLHKGFLHRDIAMHGVFLLLDPVEMKPFVPGNFSQVSEQPWEDGQILQDQVERVRKAIADLGITGSCRGVVQPSDMTVKMKDYYASIESADKPVSLNFASAIASLTGDYNDPAGLLRVHVFWIIEVHPAFGAIPAFPCGRPRILLLYHSIGRNTQPRTGRNRRSQHFAC